MTTRKEIVNKAKKSVGRCESKGTHRHIIDTYNRHKPLARGYTVKYTDDWCATTVSFWFIICHAVNLIGGTECGVQKFIDIFKRKGIWVENGRIRPDAGDIICYNWNDNTQPNDGWADHIGLVEKVNGDMITVLEGNMEDGRVGRRNIPVGWGYIRGYARPEYAPEKKKRTVYYPKCSPKETSLVDGLEAIKVNSSFGFRIKIAKANGYRSYQGTSKQNRKLLDLLKKGKLKRVK